MTEKSSIALETLREGCERALSIGVRVFVNFDPSQLLPARTYLRGWAPERFLLLDDVTSHDANVEFRSGATWRLKYVAGGFVCVADTTYLERAASSIGAVYVSFPEAIHVHSLRMHKRVTMRQPAEYAYVSPDSGLPEAMAGTTLTNLSVGGCAIWVEEHVATDTRLAVAIAPAPDTAPVMFTGTVRRCTPGMGGHTVGLEFDPANDAQIHVLQHLLGSVLGEPDTFSDAR